MLGALGAFSGVALGSQRGQDLDTVLGLSRRGRKAGRQAPDCLSEEAGRESDLQQNGRWSSDRGARGEHPLAALPRVLLHHVTARPALTRWGHFPPRTHGLFRTVASCGQQVGASCASEPSQERNSPRSPRQAPAICPPPLGPCQTAGCQVRTAVKVQSLSVVSSSDSRRKELFECK